MFGNNNAVRTTGLGLLLLPVLHNLLESSSENLICRKLRAEAGPVQTPPVGRNRSPRGLGPGQLSQLTLNTKLGTRQT